MRTLEEHAQALADGHTSSRALVEQCPARIADPNGEGARAFIKVHAEQARAMADAMDTLRSARREPGGYAGIPVSLKDLFDIAGEATPGRFAGSG
jgi:aspartyl-tRNA(Asn)/glutamyl-tRNA(Gln) amidotransferase subunit A